MKARLEMNGRYTIVDVVDTSTTADGTWTAYNLSNGAIVDVCKDGKVNVVNIGKSAPAEKFYLL